MRVISTNQMRALEENSEFLGVSRLTLMENAGRAVANCLVTKYENLSKIRVLVVAGPGNNGGDGFVAARHLACRGAHVDVIILAKPEQIRTREARKNFDIINNMMMSIHIYKATSVDKLRKLRDLFNSANVIIDAILGTGIKGIVREPLFTAIEMINSSNAFKVAVDVPSGLNSDTGEVHGVAVKADITITFHAAKKGLLLESAKEYVGELVVADIGIPREAEMIVGPGDVKPLIKPRDPWSKKGDFGRVLVIGGSSEYSGAPALAALASLRTGADLVIVATPSSVANVIRSFSPNIIVRSLSGDFLNIKHLERLIDLTARATSVVIGPGLGLEEETIEVVNEYVEKVSDKVKLVIDADALKAISREINVVKRRKVILTPHAGEFRILTQVALSKDIEDRRRSVMDAASKLKVVLLVKGHYDVISDGSRVKVNVTGNPSMTVGGTGDILSGILATLASWSDDLFQVACAGAFINGLAGDLASKELGNHIIATDLLEFIPRVFKILGEKRVLSRGYSMLERSLE